MSKTRSFGWLRDLPDFRDKLFIPKPSVVVDKKNIDFRKDHVMPDIKDQLDLGSCTGNGWAYAIEFNMLNKQVSKIDLAALPFSRLFIYYNERVLEGTTKFDAGAYIRDGIKSIAKDGVCKEKTWPYVVKKFAAKPTTTAYSEALNFKSVTYMRVENTQPLAIQDALNQGYPIVFGFTVYDSFLSAEVERTGTVPMPLKKERVQGGHCCVIVGVDNNKNRYVCANSWGTSWGQDGYFTIPIAYLTNGSLASDFWISKQIL